jgi:hypothetical protein
LRARGCSTPGPADSLAPPSPRPAQRAAPVSLRDLALQLVQVLTVVALIPVFIEPNR